MKHFRVTAGYFPVMPGVRLALTAAQSGARAHALRQLEAAPDGGGLYEVTVKTGFKLGEVFGYEGPMDKARLAEVVDAATGRAFTAADFAQAVSERVGEATASALDDGQLEAVAAAMADMDPADKALFTRAGKPDAKALSAAVGFEVGARVRDDVWAAVKAVLALVEQVEEELRSPDGGGAAEELPV